MTVTDRVSRALEEQSHQYGPHSHLTDTYQQVLGRSSQLRKRRRARTATGAVLGIVAVVAGTAVVPGLISAGSPRQPAPAAPSADLAAMKIAPSPLAPRELAAQAWAGQQLVVWGGAATVGEGSGTSSSMFNDGASFDPSAHQWRAIEPGPLSARMGPAVAVVDHQVILAGGRNASRTLPEAAVFDPADGRWSRLPDSPNCPELAAVLDGAVYTYGGCGTGGEFAVLTRPTQPAKAAWESVERAPIDDIRTLVALDGDIVAVNSLGELASYSPLAGWSQLAAVRGLTGGEVPEVAVAGGRLYAIANVETGTGAAARIWLWDGRSWTAVTTAPDADAPEGPRAVGTDRSLLWGTDSGVCSYTLETGRTSCLIESGAGRALTTLVPGVDGTVYLWGGRTPPGSGTLNAEGIELAVD